jgi:LysM repeat protein
MDKEYWSTLPFKPFYKKKSFLSKIRNFIKSKKWTFLFSSLFFIYMTFSTIHFALQSKEIELLKNISNTKEQLLIAEKNKVGLLEAEVEKLKSHMLEYDKEPKEEIVRYILTNWKGSVSEKVANETATIILQKSNEFNLPWTTIVGMTQVESQFNPYLVSNKGARGLMQVMFNVWGKEFKIPSKYILHDVERGIHFGCKVLRHYLDKTKNNMTKALYLYLGGPNPMRKGWKNRVGARAQKEYATKVYAATGQFITFRTMPAEIEEEIVSKIEVEKPKNIDMKRAQKDVGDYVEIKEVQLDTIHIIRLGDLLSNIAKWYTGNSNNWKLIQDLNPSLRPTKLYVGQKVRIPNNMVSTKTLMPIGFGTNPEKGDAENAN